LCNINLECLGGGRGKRGVRECETSACIHDYDVILPFLGILVSKNVFLITSLSWEIDKLNLYIYLSEKFDFLFSSGEFY
jgi:hypothetical protein